MSAHHAIDASAYEPAGTPIVEVLNFGIGSQRQASLQIKKDEIMELKPANLSSTCALAAPVRCPRCDDWMVAPVSSEFVKDGEIRHHWECDYCRQTFSTFIWLTRHGPIAKRPPALAGSFCNPNRWT